MDARHGFLQKEASFFPTCQVRVVVRFYVSLLLLLFFFFLFLLLLLLRRRAVSPQPRAAMSSVPCRTSTATIWAQCSLPDLNGDHLSSVRSLPDLNRDHLRSVFPAGICAQCSLPDLNRDHLRSVFPAGPQPRPSAFSVPCRTSTAR